MGGEAVREGCAMAERLEREPGDGAQGGVRDTGAPAEDQARERGGRAGEHESRTQKALGGRREGREVKETCRMNAPRGALLCSYAHQSSREGLGDSSFITLKPLTAVYLLKDVYL